MISSRAAINGANGQADDGCRVLVVLPRPCWPPDTGAKLRNMHLMRGLTGRCDVRILAFDDGTARAEDAGRWLGADPRIMLVPRGRCCGPLNVARGALGRTPLPVLNYTSAAMASAIKQALDSEPCDIFQLEGTQLGGYVSAAQMTVHRPVVVCDWHNVESEILARYAASSGNAARRWYAARTAVRMAGFERQLAAACDGHIAVTGRDADRIRPHSNGAPVRVTDNGVDVCQHADEEINRAYARWRPGVALPIKRHRILFVGSMDYHANVEAAEWFARHAWPGVHAAHPDWAYTVVGRSPAPEVRALAGVRGVEVTGTVPDIRPYYREAVASVVPLHVGGGSRLKILESMAAGVPVVSSRLGAEGLDVEHGRDVLLAETPHEFAAALDCLDGGDLPRALAARARATVAARYDWARLADRLAAFHLELLERRREVAQYPAGAQ